MIFRKKGYMVAFLIVILVFFNSCGTPYVGSADEEVDRKSGIEIQKEKGIQEESSLEETDTQIETSLQEDFETKEVSLQEEASVLETNGEKKIPEKATYISQNFLDFLENTLMEGTEIEEIKRLVSDRLLEGEELSAYGSDPVVKEYIEYVEGLIKGGSRFFIVDGDNDGIEDIFVWANNGGSIGNNSRYFLKGQEDGSFQCTSDIDGTTQEIAFVSYEGKNYLLETSYNYNQKEYDGFIVSLYEEGEVIETISIKKMMFSYEPEVIYCMEGYEKLAKDCAEAGEKGFRKEYNYDIWDYRIGNAEEKEEDWDSVCERLGWDASWREDVFSSDLNNNGKEEWYLKGISYPSTLNTICYLNEKLFLEEYPGEEKSILDTYQLEHEGVPLIFWIDEVNGKRVVCLLCYKAMKREMVYGYLIENDNVNKVMEINYIGKPEAVYNIYTKGINYYHNPWGVKG